MNHKLLIDTVGISHQECIEKDNGGFEYIPIKVDVPAGTLGTVVIDYCYNQYTVSGKVRTCIYDFITVDGVQVKNISHNSYTYA